MVTVQNYILDCLRVAGLSVVGIEFVHCVLGQSFNKGEQVIINSSGEPTHTNIEADESE